MIKKEMVCLPKILLKKDKLFFKKMLKNFIIFLKIIKKWYNFRKWIIFIHQIFIFKKMAIFMNAEEIQDL